jgi:hypothetical protein
MRLGFRPFCTNAIDAMITKIGRCSRQIGLIEVVLDTTSSPDDNDDIGIDFDFASSASDFAYLISSTAKATEHSNTITVSIMKNTDGEKPIAF